jgi:hypothetical protein
MAENPFRCSPPRRADNKAPWRPRQSITLWSSSLLEKRNPVLINGPTAAQPRRYHYIILLLFSLSLFLASCIGGNRARREEKKNQIYRRKGCRRRIKRRACEEASNPFFPNCRRVEELIISIYTTAPYAVL